MAVERLKFEQCSTYTANFVYYSIVADAFISAIGTVPLLAVVSMKLAFFLLFLVSLPLRACHLLIAGLLSEAGTGVMRHTVLLNEVGSGSETDDSIALTLVLLLLVNQQQII